MKKLFNFHLQRLFLLALLLLPLRSFAFSGWEHETVSTMSLMVASNYISLAHANDAKDENRWQTFHATTCEFIGGLQRGSKPSNVNFGTIVMLVDYMRDPYTMLHGDQTGSGWPTNTPSSNLSYLEALSSDSSSYIGASHSNFDHFQGRAMFAFWFWHKQAVTVAQEDNLWGALMLEAYADHFLEDMFAPGHLLAPRDDNAHDMYTLMLHDYYNERGLNYSIPSPADLTALTRTMQQFVQAAPLTVATRGGGRNAKQIILATNALASFATTLLSSNAEIECFGDSRIKQNPQQLPLVVSYVSRAISDVVESYLGKKTVNSFEKYRWDCKFFPMKNKPRIQALDFELAFGKLTAYDHPQTLNTNDFLFPQITLASVAERITDQMLTDGIQSLATNETILQRVIHTPDVVLPARLTYPITETPGPDALHNRGAGVSVGFQTIELWDADGSDSTHIRGLWEAGAVVAGRRFDQLQNDWQISSLYPKQVVVALGYSGVADTAEQGHGAFARVILPWPQVNLDVNLIVGTRYYFGNGLHDAWGDYENLRLEWGMHLSSIFIGIGHDRYPTRDKLANGFMVEAGATFAFPVSRWKNILSAGD